ncbi:UNVERIFIED_CONTAM: hypothetical protein H355_000906, partial [Colinus virginianus]
MHRETPKVARGCGAEGAAPHEGCGADGGSDAEEGGADPNAERPQILRTAPNGPKTETPKIGAQDLEVDSDTDVEEELNPSVPHPENPLRDQRAPRMTPKEPAVGMETPNADPKGSQSGGHHILEVDSDTDVEGELNPNVPHPENPLRDHTSPHIPPKCPTVGMETPSPDPKGSQSGGHHSLEVDSDTDVEEELNPDVPHSRNKRTPHLTPKDLTVVMETPNPDPKGPRSEDRSLEVDSDTDIEGEEVNPDVPHPENPLRDQRAPHMTPKEPTVGMETPNADPKGPQSGGHHILEVDSDTDVEEELNPDVPHPENRLRNHRTPHMTPKEPTLVMETPNPDPKGPRSGAHQDPEGYEVHVTPGVRPEPEQMRDIITCSGGTFLPSMPCTYGVLRRVFQSYGRYVRLTGHLHSSIPQAKRIIWSEVGEILLGEELEAERRRGQSLEAELEAEKRRSQSLEAELEAEKRRSQSLEAELEAERRRGRLLGAELEAERRRSRLLGAELEAERRRGQSLEAELDAKKRRGQSLWAELDMEKRRSQSLEAELAAERRRGQGVGAEPDGGQQE